MLELLAFINHVLSEASTSPVVRCADRQLDGRCGPRSAVGGILEVIGRGNLRSQGHNLFFLDFVGIIRLTNMLLHAVLRLV